MGLDMLMSMFGGLGAGGIGVLNVPDGKSSSFVNLRFYPWTFIYDDDDDYCF